MNYNKLLKKDLIEILKEKDKKIEELTNELVSLEEYCGSLEQTPFKDDVIETTKADTIEDLRLRLSRNGLITNELEEFLDNYLRWEI